MANLITEKQNRSVRSDYLTRLSSAGVILAALLGLYVLAYVAPYYIAINEKDQKVAEQFNSVISVENKENIGESAARIVNQTVEELKAVEMYYGPDRAIPSAFLADLIRAKNQGIQINRVSLTISDRAAIQVSGQAKDRESLVQFIEDLKTKSGFANVDSPISDFANNKNISFSLNIKTSL